MEALAVSAVVGAAAVIGIDPEAEVVAFIGAVGDLGVGHRVDHVARHAIDLLAYREICVVAVAWNGITSRLYREPGDLGERDVHVVRLALELSEILQEPRIDGVLEQTLPCAVTGLADGEERH